MRQLERRPGSSGRAPVVLTVALTVALAGGAAFHADTLRFTLAQGAEVIPVFGTERFAWDQELSAAFPLASLQFSVFVDDVRRPLHGVLCAETQGTAAACSAPLPYLSVGIHTLEILATAGRNDSERSAALTVERLETPPTWTGDPASMRLAPVPALADEGLVVVRGLEQPTDLAFLPDGRLVVTERSGRVRVVSRLPAGASLPPPALQLDPIVSSDGRGLFAVAVHPDFVRNRYVYLAYTARNADGRVTYRVVRTREAGGTLGEVATLLDDVPAPAPGGITARFGPDRKLYVAFSGCPAHAPCVARSYNGTVLRLEDDGTTPADSRAASPVYRQGLDIPTGLAWSGDGTLWIAEQRADGSARITSSAGVVRRLPAGSTPGGLAAIVPSAGSDGELWVTRLTSGQSALRFQQATSGELAPGSAIAGIPAGAGCLTSAPDGWVYVCTPERMTDGVADDRIVRVMRP